MLDSTCAKLLCLHKVLGQLKKYFSSFNVVQANFFLDKILFESLELHPEIQIILHKSSRIK